MLGLLTKLVSNLNKSEMGLCHNIFTIFVMTEAYFFIFCTDLLLSMYLEYLVF